MGEGGVGIRLRFRTAVLKVWSAEGGAGQILGIGTYN